jgi:hypothetical protein
MLDDRDGGDIDCHPAKFGALLTPNAVEEPAAAFGFDF